MDKISLAVQDAVVRIREIPIDLAHPQARFGRRDPGNLDLSCGPLDEEQHEEPLQPSPGPYSTVNKSAATISSQCRLRNSFQVVFRLRSGAGSMPCRRRISAIVGGPIVCPRLDTAPWILS
jgi:hypothetical protein